MMQFRPLSFFDHRFQRGSSLQEVLMAIVVFAVGILAVVQIFPRGLDVLKKSRASRVAVHLAQGEMERLRLRADELPEFMKVAAEIEDIPGGSLYFFRAVEPFRGPEEFYPGGGALVNTISRSGMLSVQGEQPQKRWPMVCGVNRANWIIGESKKLPGPRFCGGDQSKHFGSILHLNFAPFDYKRFRKHSLIVYGASFPVKFDQYPDDGLKKAKACYIQGDDVWFPSVAGGNYRIGLSLNMREGRRQTSVQLIMNINCEGFLWHNGDYWRMSISGHLPKLLGDRMPKGHLESVDWSTFRVFPVFEEIRFKDQFSSVNPYQYKLLNRGLGALMIHPKVAFESALQEEFPRIYFDYQAYDWRILHDELTVPSVQAPEVKLSLDRVKKKGQKDPDLIPYIGLGIRGGPLALKGVDFTLIDLETGGEIDPKDYKVDYREGLIRFKFDKGAHAIPARVHYPQNSTMRIKNLQGRKLMALYQRDGEWALQIERPADNYSILTTSAPRALKAGECYLGSRFSSRIYFPKRDIGKLVRIGEIHYTKGGETGILRDQVYRILASQGGGPPYVDFALEYLDGSSVARFDPAIAMPVQRVCGLSASVQVFWNSEIVRLKPDSESDAGIKNRQALLNWSDHYNRKEINSVLVPE